MSGAQHCLRIDDEISRPITHDQETILIKRVNDFLRVKQIDAIIFEDYDKGVVTPRVIKEIITEATSRQIPVAVDPKRRNFSQYRGATLFKPNFKELCEGMNVDVRKNDIDAIHQLVSDFQRMMDIKHVMVTLSELGMIISDGHSFTHVPSHVREVADVSGAGDTVVSVATLCLACKLDPPELARISNIAGGLVCEHKGVVPVDKHQLLEEVRK
jgi:rfaE bifunctional protein kinase chain/domain